jgi:predicted membrane protein
MLVNMLFVESFTWWLWTIKYYKIATWNLNYENLEYWQSMQKQGICDNKLVCCILFCFILKDVNKYVNK